MNWLDFTSSVVHAVLSWPVAIVLIVFILRKSFAQVIVSLSNVKYKGMGQEIDISMDIERLRKDAEQAKVGDREQREGVPKSRTFNPNAQAPEANRDGGLDGFTEEQILGVAQVSPAAAIVATWAEVESEINAIVLRSGLSPDYPPYNSALRNIHWLRQSDKITEEFVGLLDELRLIRNKASHSRYTADDTRVNVSVEDAVAYWRVSRDVLATLRLIQRSPEQGRISAR